ncbi:MAG TPA: hypothetical protein GX733_05220 [Tissierellia bacterium]|nr:hypothetical protein [Tissierellia bacterium]
METMMNYWRDVFEAQKKAAEEWQKTFQPDQDKDAPANPFASYGDMMKWWQQGQSLMNQWSQMMGQGAAFEPWKVWQDQMGDPMKAWQNWMQGDAFKAWQETMQDPSKAWQNWMQGDAFNVWQEAIQKYNPMQMSKYMGQTNQEVFEKMLHATQFKESVNRFWQDLNKNLVVEPGEQSEKLVQEMAEKYQALLKDNLLPLLPEQMRFYVESPYKLAQNALQTVETFVAPWRDSYPKMSSLMIESMSSDPSKFRDVLKIWQENYDKTVGEMIKSPVVGSNRELIEQQNKMVHSMVEMSVAMTEYMGSIGTVAAENAKDAVERYIQLTQDASEPKTFQDFYRFLSTDIEKAIEKYFFTEEFSKIIAKTTDSYMKFKIESDKLVERFLAQTPIVTTGEVDNVFKNVQDLKREVRSLRRKITELEGKLEEPAKK